MAMSFPEKKISLKDEEQCHHDVIMSTEKLKESLIASTTEKP